MSMAFVIIGDIVPPRERGRYVGFLTSVFAFAAVAGPLVGGFIVDNASWRWLFTINIPLGIVALFVTSVAPPGALQPARPPHRLARRHPPGRRCDRHRAAHHVGRQAVRVGIVPRPRPRRSSPSS